MRRGPLHDIEAALYRDAAKEIPGAEEVLQDYLEEKGLKRRRSRTKCWWECRGPTTSRRSRLWAATNRGWLFSIDNDRSSEAYYLDHGPFKGEYTDRNIMAYITRPGLESIKNSETRSSWHRTVEEARQWIEGTMGTGPCPVNPKHRLRARR